MRALNPASPTSASEPSPPIGSRARPARALAAAVAALLAVAASVPGQGQPVQTPVPAAPGADPSNWPWPGNGTKLVSEVPGGRVIAQGQKIWRIVHGRRRPLDCTFLPEGFGRIFDLAGHPEALTFIAGATGLYVTGPGTDVCDTVDRRDGGPVGRPVGLHVDDSGKLWIATDQEFGCMDTDLFYGRVFNATDGYPDLVLLEGDSVMPTGPFTGLAVAEDGSILLATPSQLFGYNPGQLPKPTIKVHSVAGQPYSQTEIYEVDGGVPLELSAECAGEPEFRYRRIGWHECEPLDAKRPFIQWLFPGNYQIEIFAMDRELNRSDPVRINIWNNFPFYKEPWFLGTALVLAEIGLMLVLFRGLRGRRLASKATAVVSMIILLLIGLQVATGLRKAGRGVRFRGFNVNIDYSIRQGTLHKLQLMGRERGKDAYFELEPYRAGGGESAHRRAVELIYAGAKARQRFLEDCNRNYPDEPLDAIGMRQLRWRLQRQGAVEVAPLRLMRHEDTVDRSSSVPRAKGNPQGKGKTKRKATKGKKPKSEGGG